VPLRNRLARLVASDSDSSDGQTTATATDGGTTTSTTDSAASTPSAKARLASAIPKPLTRSTGDSQLWTVGGTEDYHEIEPAAYDYKRYRELATTVDIVGAGLDIKVGEIVRPGFYIDAEDDAAKEELTEWASGCAIHGGEIDQDFGSLLPQLVHGHLRDGDAPIELVWDDPEEGNRLEYLQPIDPATLALLTYPGSSMLILPDDDEPPEGTPENKRGENAAYVQYPDADESAFYTDEDEIYLSQVDVIRLPREPGFTERSPTGSGRSSAAAVSYLNDSDTGGNIRGTSLIERIADEAARLRALSQDYYNALAATSHPRLKIEFEDTVVEGTEEGYTITEIDPDTGEPIDVEYEGPRVIHWDDESIGDFMDALDRDETQWDPTGDAHSGGEWTDPGGKIGTPPGVTANIVKADAPDIQHAATLSVNRIFGGLGVPKFMAGFGEDLNRRISEEQEKRFEQDVRSTRRYIEKRLTPIFELKAEELAERDDSDVSNTEGVAFKIGTDQQEDALQDEDFDAEKFQTLMGGMVQGSQVFSKETLVEDFARMDPEEILAESDSGTAGSGQQPQQLDQAQDQNQAGEMTDGPAGSQQDSSQSPAGGPNSSVPDLPPRDSFDTDQEYNLYKEFLNRVYFSRRGIDVLDTTAEDSPQAGTDAGTEIDADVAETTSATASDGTDDAELAWNPALHPRDPRTGKFVERPYDVPDSVKSLGTREIVEELTSSDPEFGDRTEGLTVDMDDDFRSVVENAQGQSGRSEGGGEDRAEIETDTETATNETTGTGESVDGIERAYAGLSGDEIDDRLANRTGAEVDFTYNDEDARRAAATIERAVEAEPEQRDEYNRLGGVRTITSDPDHPRLSQTEIGTDYGLHDPNTRTLYLSPDLFGQEISDEIRFDEEDGFSAPGTPEGVIQHEVAHAYHSHIARKGDNNIRLSAERSQFYRDEGEAAETVSLYAGENPQELVAEVYSGTFEGKEFSDKVYELYDKFYGPSLDIPQAPDTAREHGTTA